MECGAGAVVGSNPFLEVPDPSKALEYKKGPVMRKCCVSADGRRTPYGKRGWRMFYAALRDQVLYLHKNVNTYGKFVQTGGVGKTKTSYLFWCVENEKKISIRFYQVFDFVSSRFLQFWPSRQKHSIPSFIHPGGDAQSG